MDELFSLTFDGFYHPGMTMPCITDSDPRGEIEESIRIDILHHSSSCSLHHKGIDTRIGLRDKPLVLFQNLFRLRSRKFSYDRRNLIYFHLFLLLTEVRSSVEQTPILLPFLFIIKDLGNIEKEIY
jgi:hypothetical protein